MRLNDEAYEEIKQTVIDTFEEYDVRSVPICSFEMATKMGLKVKPYSSFSKEDRACLLMESEDGFSTENFSGEWCIYYNDSDKCYPRINNTIMHEIGHYALGHMHGSEEEEAEAKFFAKYALAPPPLIHKLCNNVTPGWIQEVFNLSAEAAEYAYEYYNNWLKYGQPEYTSYEKKILQLFTIA